MKTAMQANYSAAIVYNYKSDELIPMGGDSDDVIPSVFIGYTDAARLLKDYTYYTGGQEYVIRITDNPPFDINAYLLPFAIVVGICFLIMLAIMIFKCIQDRRRERRHRLPKSSLKKIPTKKFVAGDEEQYETCCICLDDYEVGDKLRILPCGHAYHMKCIDPWLLKNKRVCPQCRKKVIIDLPLNHRCNFHRCSPAGRLHPATPRARQRTRELRSCNGRVPSVLPQALFSCKMRTPSGGRREGWRAGAYLASCLCHTE